MLEGPILVHALDAHAVGLERFAVDGLLPYRGDREPPLPGTAARNRLRIVNKARAKKQRPFLLAESWSSNIEKRRDCSLFASY